MSANIQDMISTWRTKDLLDYMLKDLEKRVKRDKTTKQSVFFAGESAYLPEPFNLFLKGPSGIGKTYNVVETLRYFPREDIWFLGGLSPKALVHDYGVLLNRHGEPIDLADKPIRPKKRSYSSEEEYNEALAQWKEELKAWSEEIRGSYTLIDLSHRILVFLEAPEFETFRMLLPILSHDTERIEYKYTDKKTLRTIKVIIEGWPAAIFLTVDKQYIEELATRGFTSTPEASKEKIGEANVLTNLKASLPWQYNAETEEARNIQKLILSLKNQFGNGVNIAVPFTNLHELFPKEIIRDMRDFQHFIQFLKTITALYFYQRVFLVANGKKFLLSTVEDIKKALEIYEDVFETTRTGTERRILDFYHDLVKAEEKWYLKEITAKYNEAHKEKKLSSETVRKMLERLDEIGYIDIRKDDTDKRLNLYVPLVTEPENEKSTISHILKTWTVSRAKLEEGFKNWKENILKTGSLYTYANFDENKWGESQITIDEAEKIILNAYCSGDSDLRISSNEDSEPKMETKPENVHKSETCQIVDNSKLQLKTEDIERVVKLDEPHYGTCGKCERKATLYWNLQTFQGDWADLCEECGTELQRQKQREV